MTVTIDDPARASFLAWILYRLLTRRPPDSAVEGTYEIRSGALAVTLVVGEDSIRVLSGAAPGSQVRINAPLGLLTAIGAGALPWRDVLARRLRFRGSIQRLLWLAHALRTP